MSHGENKQEVLCNVLNPFQNHLGIKVTNKKIKENKLDGQDFFGKEKTFFKPAIPVETKNLLNVLIKIKLQE